MVEKVTVLVGRAWAQIATGPAVHHGAWWVRFGPNARGTTTPYMLARGDLNTIVVRGSAKFDSDQTVRFTDTGGSLRCADRHGAGLYSYRRLPGNRVRFIPIRETCARRQAVVTNRAFTFAGAAGPAATLVSRMVDAHPGVVWHESRSTGLPYNGALAKGVLLPVSGPFHATWYPDVGMGNATSRRYGSRRLVASILWVAHHIHDRRGPGSPPLLVGDLSRPLGGRFRSRHGGLAHVSHQNGLDVDVYYPRRDRRVAPPSSPHQVDQVATRQIVCLFLQAGASHVFVGPAIKVRRTAGVVVTLPVAHHDHMHVRFPNNGIVRRRAKCS